MSKGTELYNVINQQDLIGIYRTLYPTESACNAGDPGSVPGLGRSPGEGSGNPLQYSYLENSMD